MASEAPSTTAAAAGAGYGAQDVTAVNTVRCLAADMVQKANSGHPGAPMGCAPMAHVLWSQIMNYSPTNPKWSNRDRFVLSNGHACALLYSMLHLTGYDLSMDDLKNFRQLNSKTPGHPENHMTAGVEVSTGPLGQGISNAVGLAIGQTHLAASFNKTGFNVSDHFTYVICGDGCLQEGVSGEASSLAGHLGLGRLIVLYDDNDITIDGGTNLSFTEDVLKRYEAYGWHTSVVKDGDSDLAGIHAAVEAAKAVTDRPSIIKVHTTIGIGSAKQGTSKVHGSPLGDEDLASAKTALGLDGTKTFNVADEVTALYKASTARAAAAETAWNTMMEAYAKEYPTEAAEYARRMAGELPADWKKSLKTFTDADGKLATRATSGKVLNSLAPILPEIVGGSADLTPSNNTLLDCSSDYQKDTPAGRYFRFGVREHAMAAICNGLAAYGGFLPYCATFLNFCGYALGSVRLSALSHLQTLYIFTHDSIGLGEDGPTHQPVEMLASVRSMPNMTVFRPADGNETAAAYVAAVENKTGPTLLALSRQGLPQLASSSVEAALKGAYIANPAGDDTKEDTPDLVIAATGSEVSLALEVAGAMSKNVRVVSMPCLELYDQQDAAYKRALFPAGVPVMSLEAASSFGWSKYAHTHVAVDSFGMSAPGGQAMEHFGFSVANVTEKANLTLAHYTANPVPELVEKPF